MRIRALVVLVSLAGNLDSAATRAEATTFTPPLLIDNSERSDAATDVFATVTKSGAIVSGGGCPTAVCAADTPIAELIVPAGRYALLAKVNLDHDANGFATVVCALRVGTLDLDLNVIRLQPSGESHIDNAVSPLQAVPDVGRDTQILLSCKFQNTPIPDSTLGPGKISFRFARITAIKIDGMLWRIRAPHTASRCPDDAICLQAADRRGLDRRRDNPHRRGASRSCHERRVRRRREIRLDRRGKGRADTVGSRRQSAIFAKINLDQDDASASTVARIDCVLKASAVEDLNVIRLQFSSEKELDNTAVAFQAYTNSNRFH